MSKAVSALNEVEFAGYCTIREAGLRGMITLRGNLSAKALQKAATQATGAAFPKQGACAFQGDKGIAWMSPDEVLLLVPHSDADDCVAKIETALKGSHFLAQNVSDARAVFQIEGPKVREVLAKLVPVDMSPAAFPVGHFRRTRLAQVAAAFSLKSEHTAELICFRSGAGYVFDILKDAAQPGSEISVL